MSYRHLSATKRVGGKVRRYKNLAAFNSECSKRGIPGITKNACRLTNMRCTKDGGGLATVFSEYPGRVQSIYHSGAKATGTWLLHFASCPIMKRHLRGRVHPGSHTFSLDPPTGLGRSRKRRHKSMTAAQLRDKLACKIFGGKACR